jgi:mRNA interferase MazF
MAAKVRPCLVISISAATEDRAIATVIPHTTSLRNTRFEVGIQKRFLRQGGFDAQSPITIPHAKFIRRIGSLSADELTLVEQAVKLWLGIAP